MHLFSEPVGGDFMSEFAEKPDDGGTQKVRVDIHSLQAFGDFVRRELHENIAPMATRVGQTLQNGAVIGRRLPSADLESMNTKHAECADLMGEQLQSYMTSLSILADAAHSIAARYSSSDSVSGATTNDIDTAFVTATGQDVPPLPTTPHGSTL
jgi:hypothetical protein